MFQAGYLTIEKQYQKRNRIKYRLNFPNLSVKNSFTDYLLNSFVSVSQKIRVADELYDILEDGEPSRLEEIFIKLFSIIAYNNFTNNYIENYEGFYASIVYAYLSSLGLQLIPEDVTNKGRIDLTLQIENKTYIFEFKVTNESPLRQIKEKKYYEKYSREIYIVGIVFDPKERNIKEFVWEKINHRPHQILTTDHTENTEKFGVFRVFRGLFSVVENLFIFALYKSLKHAKTSNWHTDL